MRLRKVLSETHKIMFFALYTWYMVLIQYILHIVYDFFFVSYKVGIAEIRLTVALVCSASDR